MKAEKHKQKQLLGVKHGWFWAACDASSHGLMATWIGAEVTLGTAPARGAGGNQWNRTLHGQTLTEVSPRTAGEPWGNREKQSGSWDIGIILYLYHRVPAGLLIIISSVFSVYIHYFIWDLITPNLEKSVSLITTMKTYLYFWNEVELDNVFAY